MISAILSDTLSGVETRNDTHFGLAVPVACPNVPSEILDPRRTWPDAAAYDRKAAELAGMFVRNFPGERRRRPVGNRGRGTEGVANFSFFLLAEASEGRRLRN